MRYDGSKETWLDRVSPMIITFAILGYTWLLIVMGLHHYCDCSQKPTPAPVLDRSSEVIPLSGQSILEE